MNNYSDSLRIGLIYRAASLCLKGVSHFLRLLQVVIVSFLLALGFMLPPVYAAETTDKNAPSPLVTFEIVNLIQSKSIPKSLTGVAGSPKRGQALMVDRKKGNCIACHGLDMFAEKAKKEPNIYADMGEVGPVLDGVANRYKEGEIRLLLVDAKQMFPDTIMPGFYRVDRFTRVDDGFVNKPILTAQEIEDILSFLMQQK